MSLDVKDSDEDYEKTTEYAPEEGKGESIRTNASTAEPHPMAKRGGNIVVDVEAQVSLPHGDSPPLILTESRNALPNPNLVSWDSPDDPENPLNWPSWLRWTLIILVSGAAFTSGLASSMFAPSVPTLMEEFHATNSALGTFVVTIFVLGMAAGPVVFGPMSELYGRLPIQHIGNVGLLVMTIACAVCTTFEMMIGFRLVQGIFGAVPLTNGGALIADMVRQERRGRAMGFYTIGVLLAPVVGPVAGGFLSEAKGWRWNFWLLAILVWLSDVTDASSAAKNRRLSRTFAD
jgi:multidrug resistance protein